MAQFKAILPKKFNAKAMLAEVVKEMKDIGKDISKDFDDTVSTWKDKPPFVKEFEQNSQRIRTYTGTSDKVYGYVSQGTKPHLIRPKRAKVLRFQGGVYTAKTQPGTIKARSGGASGGEVFSKGVRHPGSEGRDFPETIAKKRKSPFPKRMREAMRRGAKKSGHAI